MMDRAAFLEARRAGIGSSDVAKVLGLSPWGTALDVYLDKVNPPANGEISPALEWGLRKEPIIAAAIMDRYGWCLAKPVTTAHREHSFLIASPDRMNDAGELIEIKTASMATGWGEAETAEIPEQYWVQVQHQLEVVASHGQLAEAAWVFVLIGHHDFRRYRIPRDPGYLAAVIDPLREFWARVEHRAPPEPDWSHPATLAAVQRLYQPREGSRIDLPFSAVAMADVYERAGLTIKECEAVRDEIKARFTVALGEAETGLLPDGRTVSRKAVHRKAYQVKESDYVMFKLNQAKGRS